MYAVFSIIMDMLIKNEKMLCIIKVLGFVFTLCLSIDIIFELLSVELI